MDNSNKTASRDANTLAAYQQNTQTHNSIKMLTPSERYAAINTALENGSITSTDAGKILGFYEPQEGINLIPAYAIEPEAINWVWKGYLAAGKLHILAGVPGTGKTTIALDFAATISLGRPWPDGSSCECGNTLIWSGEDDLKDTLVPRLIAAGTDRKKIHFIGDIKEETTEPRSFNPATDVPKLLIKATEVGNIKLIIIDPIIHAVTGDSHKNGDVRQSLKPIVKLAMQLNAAVLGITHFTKGTAGKEPLDRVTGSLAFGAVARIVLVTAKDTTANNDARSILARVKSNIGLFGGGHYYKIRETTLTNYPDIATSKIMWLGEADGTVQELLCQQQDNAAQLSAIQEAQDYLISILGDGPMNAKDVYLSCTNVGLSKTTVSRAKKALCIKPHKVGYGKDSLWMWSLDSKIANTIKDAHPEVLNTFEQNEHLKTQLMHKHPSIVEGCLLKDILDQADPNDFEDLQDLEVVKSFTLHLIGCGKLHRNTSANC